MTILDYYYSYDANNCTCKGYEYCSNCGKVEVIRPIASRYTIMISHRSTQTEQT